MDFEAAARFPEELGNFIREKGYLTDQIFNADETGLFWKKMPKRTFISKAESTVLGLKATKERLTILLCSNVSGDFILHPMVVNKLSNLRALKDKDKLSLAVFWKTNKKAWDTTNLFSMWFLECFIPSVKSYLEKKKMEFKVSLLIGNASGYLTSLKTLSTLMD